MTVNRWTRNVSYPSTRHIHALSVQICVCPTLTIPRYRRCRKVIKSVDMSRYLLCLLDLRRLLRQQGQSSDALQLVPAGRADVIVDIE